MLFKKNKQKEIVKQKGPVKPVESITIQYKGCKIDKNQIRGKLDKLAKLESALDPKNDMTQSYIKKIEELEQEIENLRKKISKIKLENEYKKNILDKNASELTNAYLRSDTAGKLDKLQAGILKKIAQDFIENLHKKMNNN